MNRLIRVAAVAALAGLPALAQSVISMHSGLIHYVEGRALLDGKPVEVKITAFPEIKEGMEFRTEDGRAEVLLNPGVFLRMSENTAIRMVGNKLSDTRIEFVSGSVIIESSGELAQKDTSVAIVSQGSTAHLRKKGIYRFDSEPAAQLRVFSGEAEVQTGSNVLIVKGGRMLALNGAVAVEKFDSKQNDALGRWSMRRAEGISLANLSAAKYVNDSGSLRNSGWYYNPYFGMYTFIPGRGIFSSPYGYRYYSPSAAYEFYYHPQPVYYGNSGYGAGGGYSGPSYNTASQTSSGYSGVTASAPVSTSSGASSGAAVSSGGASSAPSGHGGGHSR
jgi:hypothetical protein